MLRWFGNVLRGRYRHWTHANNDQFTELWNRALSLPEESRYIFKEFLVSSLSLVDFLLGPDRGRERLLPLDSLDIHEHQFMRLHRLHVAALTGTFTAINPVLQPLLSAGLQTLTDDDPEAAAVCRELAAKSPPNLKLVGPAVWSRVVDITKAPVHNDALHAYPYTILFGSVANDAFQAVRRELQGR